MSEVQQEYAEALAAYREALARLQEAKRHIPEFPRDRDKRLKRERRAARRAEQEAERERHLASLTPEQRANYLSINMIAAKALAILHQKCNVIGAVSHHEDFADAGAGVRIRLPVTYRIVNE